MINLEDYKMTDASGIGIYVGTYAKYNSGSIFGMWIDLESVSDAEEFFEVCRELHKDESDPEFMMQDYQGFPEELYHESMSADDVERVLEYIALDDDDREMLEDYCECYGGDATDPDMVDRARERSMGKFDTFQEFADAQADEMLDGYEAACAYEYTCKGAAGMIAELRKYFDYEAYARDLKYGFSMGGNGYIFSDKG